MKKNRYLPIFMLLLLSSFLHTVIVFGSGVIIPLQTATQLGSNNSTNIFSTGGATKETYYYNDSNNSDIFGDYFSGFYYNTLYGFFQLDWSSDTSKNVRILSSTDKCATGYGYKLSGYAHSDTVGLIDFDYNDSVFVYYCVDDNKLHGKAYSDIIGYQSFEGLSFEILPSFATSLLNSNDSTIFVNETTTLFSTPISSNSNTNLNQVKKEAINYGEESIFYIWKPKK